MLDPLAGSTATVQRHRSRTVLSISETVGAFTHAPIGRMRESRATTASRALPLQASIYIIELA